MAGRASHVATAAIVGGTAAALWHHGADYYRLPPALRPDAPLHGQLAPSRDLGHTLGWLGLACMVLLLLYSVRKHARWLRRLGALRHWLSGHILLGLLGPVLITFHSAYMVTGLVAIAYWSMIVTMLSGIFGRYIYAQIPNSLLGERRSAEALAREAHDLDAQLARIQEPRIREPQRLEPQRLGPLPGPLAGDAVAGTPPPAGGWNAIGALLADDLRRPVHRVRLARVLSRAGMPRDRVRDAVRLAQRRDLLRRRLALAASLTQVFRYWHALHIPFVFIMFAVVAVHVGVAILFGYAGL